MPYECIYLQQQGPLATLIMNRPTVHNAFNPQLINEITTAFQAFATDASVRVVVLTGAGSSFSAGGDIGWMQASLHFSHDQNLADARALDAMFDTINTLPKPVIGRINGPALGGGVGLVACCDLAVAVEDARFGFTEVKLGLLPAVIAQYVVPKIGVSHSRALFISGERFTAERAFEISLIHAITSPEDLDSTIQSLAQRMLTGGPQALGAAKRLVAAMWHLEKDAAKQYAIEAIAQARIGAEGQEGLAAFLNKRRPEW